MANRIVELREELNLTQEQMAKKLKVYNTTYIRWEREPMLIKLRDLIELADYHNVSLDYIAELTDDRYRH